MRTASQLYVYHRPGNERIEGVREEADGALIATRAAFARDIAPLVPLVWVQRLGFLLDRVEASAQAEFTQGLHTRACS